MFIAALFTNSHNMGAAWGFIEGWMDKQNVVYPSDGILFSPEKEGNSDTCSSMDKPWGHYATWSKSLKDKYCIILIVWNS